MTAAPASIRALTAMGPWFVGWGCRHLPLAMESPPSREGSFRVDGPLRGCWGSAPMPQHRHLREAATYHSSMKVFLSWSGDYSHAVANVVDKWVRSIFAEV